MVPNCGKYFIKVCQELIPVELESPSFVLCWLFHQPGHYHLWFMHGLKQQYHLNLFAAHFSHKVLTMVAKRMLQKLILVPLCKNLKRPQFHFGGFLSTGVCLTDCGYDWRCFVWGDEQKQETHASHCVCHASQFNSGWLWIWLRYLKVIFIRIVQNRIE